MKSLTLPFALALTLPTAATAQWNLMPTGTPPQPTEYSEACFDSWRNQVVLFGGQSSWNPLDDTFLYNGTWNQVFPATSPTPRAPGRIAFDPVRGVAVMFGGHVRLGTWLSDHWEWDGTNWTQVFPATNPGRRGRHAMVYDSLRGRMVMYGGSVFFASALDDTWEYDGNDWTRVTTAITPGGRKAAAMAYHAASGKTVLFGGITARGSMATTETWLYDGNNWTQLVTAVAPPTRHDAQMVYDPVREVCVLYGGRDGSPKVLDDTWEFDGTKWEQVRSGSPAGRSEFAMAMDTARKRVVLFGGTTDDIGNVETDETWEFGSDASFSTFGTACTGSNGVLGLSASSAPRLGLTWNVDASNLDDNSPAFLALGVSNTVWGSLPLPLPISSIGATGCVIEVAHTIPPLPMSVSGGAASYPLPLPGSGTLLGVHLYLQVLSFDRGANSFGLASSNGVDALLGN